MAGPAPAARRRALSGRSAAARRGAAACASGRRRSAATDRALLDSDTHVTRVAEAAAGVGKQAGLAQAIAIAAAGAVREAARVRVGGGLAGAQQEHENEGWESHAPERFLPSDLAPLYDYARERCHRPHACS